MEKNCNCNVILCVLRVGKGQRNGILCVLTVGKGHRNELCFKTSYRNCECKCANVTSSEGRLCLELFQSRQLENGLRILILPFPNKI